MVERYRVTGGRTVLGTPAGGVLEADLPDWQREALVWGGHLDPLPDDTQLARTPPRERGKARTAEEQPPAETAAETGVQTADVPGVEAGPDPTNGGDE